jgi:nicotinate-nucleotide pyrophosphorylase (carboxylating)
MIEEKPGVERMIRIALEEDLGAGDVTTDLVVDPGVVGRASLVAQEDLVLAGLPVFEKVFLAICPDMEFQERCEEGDLLPPGKRVCLIRGPLAGILKGERTALNFLQRMSGIATLTRRYVEKVKAFNVKILDTRKTAPGLRCFDKYAVRAGGGFNHRIGLFDGILIKDNHIVAAGSIPRAVELARKSAPHTLKVEIEVEDLSGAEAALRAGVDTVLLDNMPLEEMKRAVAMLKGRVLIEASGGMNLDTIEAVAGTGVDLISVGALTHSAKAADFSLEMLTEVI